MCERPVGLEQRKGGEKSMGGSRSLAVQGLDGLGEDLGFDSE